MNGFRHTNVFRNSRVHVCARMCATCIFRPGNLMRLPDGRVDGMKAAALAADGCIPCHETTHHQHPDGEAVCRGFYELKESLPLAVAAAIGAVEWQEPGGGDDA